VDNKHFKSLNKRSCDDVEDGTKNKKTKYEDSVSDITKVEDEQTKHEGFWVGLWQYESNYKGEDGDLHFDVSALAMAEFEKKYNTKFSLRLYQDLS
jgi:hypothetical protein